MIRCAQVYTMVRVSACVGLHKSVKRVGVDLLMVNSYGKYIADDGGSLSHESDSWCMLGLATSEERSSGMGAGSILSIGSPTRYWIMRTRNMGVFAKRSFLRRVRRRSVGGGALPRFYFFGDVWEFYFFYKTTTNILHKAFIGCVS